MINTFPCVKKLTVDGVSYFQAAAQKADEEDSNDSKNGQQVMNDVEE